MMKLQSIITSAIVLLTSACGSAQSKVEQSKTFKEMNETKQETGKNHLQIATFAAGCFWCVEAQYQQLEGVDTVVSGYLGGHVDNPTYKEVCTGTTGHAEACNIYYDPAIISYDELLAAFWVAHDPTTLNRQGNDIGTQYRSAIFYHNDEQKQKAEEYKKKLNDEKAFSGPIVTEISPYAKFYVAEDYHQNYYNQNTNQGYCQFVVKPKMDKFKKVFADKLKK